MDQHLPPWPEPPPASADWDVIVGYADRVDGYRRAGSFEACLRVAQAVSDGHRATGELPHDAGALALTVFVEVRRYRLLGSLDGTAMDYIRTLLGAMDELASERAA